MERITRANRKNKDCGKRRSLKIMTLVARDECVIGAVFHVMGEDETGEFDPFFIDRIKNCLQLMFEKDLV